MEVPVVQDTPSTDACVALDLKWKSPDPQVDAELSHPITNMSLLLIT